MIFRVEKYRFLALFLFFAGVVVAAIPLSIPVGWILIILGYIATLVVGIQNKLKISRKVGGTGLNGYVVLSLIFALLTGFLFLNVKPTGDFGEITGPDFFALIACFFGFLSMWIG